MDESSYVMHDHDRIKDILSVVRVMGSHLWIAQV